MLKEVGTSGQISLGKKFAGQLFDVQFLDTGAVQMLPVRIVPVITPARQKQELSGSDTPSDDQWHLIHAKQIAAYNAWAEQRATFSESVRMWREAEQSQQLVA